MISYYTKYRFEIWSNQPGENPTHDEKWDDVKPYHPSETDSDTINFQALEFQIYETQSPSIGAGELIDVAMNVGRGLAWQNDWSKDKTGTRLFKVLHQDAIRVR